jgi:tetratricopeptide (TPR) repeat protein
MGPQELRAIIGSFVDVFADAELYLNRSNAILVGGGRSRRSDAERLAHLRAGWRGQLAADMRLARIASPEELLASRVAGPQQLRRFARGARRVHDDDQWIELTLPAQIYRSTAAPNTRDLIALRDRSERARPMVRAFDAVQFAYHLLSAGRTSDAFHLLRATLDRGESPLLEHSIMLRDTSAQLAAALLGSGRGREALALARAELEHPDATINSLITLGPVFKIVDDWSAIERRNARLIRGWPRRPDGFLESGAALLERGRYSAAIPLLSKALELDRFGGLAWHTLGLLGRAHLGAGQIAKARKALQRSLALNPKQPKIASLLRRLALQGKPGLSK